MSLGFLFFLMLALALLLPLVVLTVALLTGILATRNPIDPAAEHNSPSPTAAKVR